jgi:hypothetical protein
VPDPARGAIRGVGPPVAVELGVAVDRGALDAEVVLGAGGLGGETVRTASTAGAWVDARSTAGWA